MIHRADISRGQPSSDDRPLLSFFLLFTPKRHRSVQFSMAESHQQTSTFSPISPRCHSNLDSFPHAGRGVDPLPCDIPHRKIPLQLGITVQQDGFIDDCFLQAKGSLRRTMVYMFKREHCSDMMLFAVRISNKINKNCINQEIVLSL